MRVRGLAAILLLVGTGGLGAANPLVEMFLNWDPSWPQRFGITGVGYGQKQDYSVGSAEIMLGALEVPAAAIGRIENEVTQIGVKADAWILPFWNVHAIFGSIDGTTTVTPAIPVIDTVEVDYGGIVYGVGTTLAYGQDWWWLSVTGVITETELDTTTSSVKAWLVTPKVGVTWKDFELWAGATYQNVDESQEGIFEVPGLGPAVFDIQLEAKEPWNWQLGARYQVSPSWFLTLEAGFGERETILAHLEVRF